MAKLHFRYGTMGSAKTAQALMHIYNFQEHGYKALLCKPATDTRTAEVWSRVGLKQNAFSMDEFMRMDLHRVKQYKVIIVDEAQFCKPSHIDFLARIVDDYDIPVFCYGLRTDYTSHLFPGAKRLFELADEISEIKTSCWCGKTAKFNTRIEDNEVIREPLENGSTIDIENKTGVQKYKALCRKHYMSGQHEMPGDFEPDSRV